MDLRNIQTHQTTDFEIKDPDGNPTGVVFVLAGPPHPQRKAAEHARQRRLMREAQKGNRLMADPAETEAERPKLLAAMTLGWSGYTRDGQPVAFSQEEAEKLYADPAMVWLADQVDEALGNRQLFTKRASVS